MNRIITALDSVRIDCKEDGLWLRIDHPGISGKAAYSLGPRDSRIVAQVVSHFEQLRREALATDEPKYNELVEAASMLLQGAHPDAGDGFYVSTESMQRLRRALEALGVS